MKITQKVPVYVIRFHAARDGWVESRVDLVSSAEGVPGLYRKVHDLFPDSDGYTDHGVDLQVRAVDVELDMEVTFGP